MSHVDSRSTKGEFARQRRSTSLNCIDGRVVSYSARSRWHADAAANAAPFMRLAAGALAEAAYLGDTLEPSDSEDEMEAESDLDNGDEEITSDVGRGAMC